MGWYEVRLAVDGARLGLAPLVLPVLIACSFPPLDTTPFCALRIASICSCHGSSTPNETPVMDLRVKWWFDPTLESSFVRWWLARRIRRFIALRFQWIGSIFVRSFCYVLTTWLVDQWLLISEWTSYNYDFTICINVWTSLYICLEILRDSYSFHI